MEGEKGAEEWREIGKGGGSGGAACEGGKRGGRGGGELQLEKGKKSWKKNGVNGDMWMAI